MESYEDYRKYNLKGMLNAHEYDLLKCLFDNRNGIFQKMRFPNVLIPIEYYTDVEELASEIPFLDWCVFGNDTFINIYLARSEPMEEIEKAREKITSCVMTKRAI